MGLGNPGSRYIRTLHNAGMDAVAYLRAEGRSNARITTLKLFSYSKEKGRIFATPNVFMNESGKAVAEALRRFSIKPERLLVVHDESDLPLGASRLSFGRGAAGHRGVQSIIDALGTKEFFRFRVGIRTERGKAGTFVLNKIAPRESSLLQGALEELVALTSSVNEKENP